MIGLSGNKFTGHGEGAAIILKAKGIRYDPNDEFEEMLLATLRGPLVCDISLSDLVTLHATNLDKQLFEGLFNPKIQFTDEEWNFIITRHAPKSTPTDILRMIASWASFPKLTAAVRQSWTSKSVTASNQFKDLLKYSRELYSTAMLTLDRIRAVYVQSTQDVEDAKDEESTSRARYLYAFNQRMIILAVFTTCYVNCLIRAMLPADERVTLRTEAVGFAKEIVSLAYQAMPLRPLGSAFVPMCLMVAWFAPIDDETRSELKNLWEQYRSDFPATRKFEIGDSVDVCGFLGDDSSQ